MPTMTDLSYVVALFGGVFLIAAGAVWWRVYTEAKEAEARAAGIDSRMIRSAAMLTSLAFGVSGVAAILGLVSVMF